MANAGSSQSDFAASHDRLPARDAHQLHPGEISLHRFTERKEGECPAGLRPLARKILADEMTCRRSLYLGQTP